MRARTAVVAGMISFGTFVTGALQAPAGTRAPSEYCGGYARPVPESLRGGHQGIPTKPNCPHTEANQRMQSESVAPESSLPARQ